MASQVQICNLALIMAGQSTIISLDDGTEYANVCNILFNDIADEVTAQGAWTSATFRAELAQLSEEGTIYYDKVYSLPTLPYCLKVISLEGDKADFVVEGRKLRTNLNSVNIKYIGRPESTEDYDIYLKDAIVARLALGLAYQFTGSAALVGRIESQYAYAINQGLALGGQQGTADRFRNNELLEARLGRSSSFPRIR